MPAAPIDYRTECGLELNADRIEVRRIVNESLAYSLSRGEMEIPNEWFPLLADSPEETEDLRRCRTLESLKQKAKAQLH